MKFHEIGDFFSVFICVSVTYYNRKNKSQKFRQASISAVWRRESTGTSSTGLYGLRKAIKNQPIRQ